MQRRNKIILQKIISKIDLEIKIGEFIKNFTIDKKKQIEKIFLIEKKITSNAEDFFWKKFKFFLKKF